MSSKKEKKNKVRRYRLNDYTAQKLGCELNKSKRYRLSKQQETQLLALAPQKIKRLYFDIETSPNVVYSWSLGFKVRLTPDQMIRERSIISIAWKWEDDSEVHALTWDENQCDKKMLEEFIPILDSADEIIGHNGRAYDEKFLRTRCIFHRIRMFPKYKSLDTLMKARSGFRFNSNTLAYLADYLGVGAKYKHSGFSMWRDIIERNSKEAMEEMVHYNKVDVVVLEDVHHAMESYITPETHVGSHNNNAKYSCPTCGSEAVSLLKNEFTSKGSIQRRMQCECCGGTHHISNSAFKLFVETSFNSKL